MGQREVEVELYDYGIQNESSDIRAHVSVVNRKIYVYETARGLEALSEVEGLKKVPAYQPGVDGKTAEGFLMPWDKITGLQAVELPGKWGWDKFKKDLPTTEKGEMAVKCVLWALECGFFPLWISGKEENGMTLQIKGVDIIVCCNKHIQVKCDYNCGEKPNGTGNLFLQVSERNPLGKH